MGSADVGGKYGQRWKEQTPQSRAEVGNADAPSFHLVLVTTGEKYCAEAAKEDVKEEEGHGGRRHYGAE